MNDIISLEQRRRERNVSPLLRRVEVMRKAARELLLNAEILEMEAYGIVDGNYDEMAAEKIKNLKALHNA